MELFNTYGSMIKTLRIRRGFGQREFARLVGTSQPKLSAVENERCLPFPNRELLELIAEKLRIDPDSGDWDHYMGLAIRPGTLSESEKELLTNPVFVGMMSAINRRQLSKEEILEMTHKINDSRKVKSASQDTHVE